MWFPEIPKGTSSHKTMKTLSNSILDALEICSGCPRKKECLEEGMRKENLPYGIWGGVLASDRVIISGVKTPVESEPWKALRTHRALARWLVRRWDV
jgi:hypothetical protein